MNQMIWDKKFLRYRIKRSLKETIEPEEILLDANKSPELEPRRLEVPLRPRIFKIFFQVVCLGFIILILQTFNLQVRRHQEYQRLGQQNRTRLVPVLPPRGIIHDRFFDQLVYNIPNFDLVILPQELPRQFQERQKVIEKAAQIAGLAASEIEEKVKKSSHFFSSLVIAGNLDQEKVFKLEEEKGKFPGLAVEKNIVRQYPKGVYFSHLLGYVSNLQPEDLKNGDSYFSVEKIGRTGLERYYQDILRGQPGQKEVEIDARGGQQREASLGLPQAGQGLVLFLDSELQAKLFDTLDRVLKNTGARRASAVALEPQSGGVLALVSLPSYDNNLFVQGISPQTFSEIANDPHGPLFNSVISGQYSPGSLVKPLVASAALQEKVITPEEKIFDPGELVLTNQYNPEIVYRFKDWKAHGWTDIYSAIAESCNVYFYTIGGGYGSRPGLGVERLEKYFRLFGFGQALGIDLAGEAAGLVPGPDWKKKNKKETWFVGDTYHLSIGQGDLLTTPLQIAAATASIANGGKLLVPRLVDKIVDSDKNIIKQTSAQVLRQNFISSANLVIVRRAMRQTVTAGSAYALRDLNIAVAGKTGTAQVAGQKNPNAWFISFAPFDNPKIVLVILVENAGEGSVVAAPAAKEILEWYFKPRNNAELIR